MHLLLRFLPGVLLLLSVPAFAQTNPFFSLYRTQYLLFNPAYAGAEDKPVLSLSGRLPYLKQRKNAAYHTRGQDFTSAATFHTRLENSNHGLGISAHYEDLGAWRALQLSGAYSYRYQLRENTVLQVGAQLGLSRATADVGVLWQVYPEIIAVTAKESAMSASLGTGAWLTASAFYAAFSIQNLLATNYRFADFRLKPRASAYLTAGYKWELNDQWQLTPSALWRIYRTTNFSNNHLTWHTVRDLNLTVTYASKYDLGLGWRGDSAPLLLSAGIRIKERLQLSVAADLTTTRWSGEMLGPSIESALRVAF